MLSAAFPQMSLPGGGGSFRGPVRARGQGMIRQGLEAYAGLPVPLPM